MRDDSRFFSQDNWPARADDKRFFLTKSPRIADGPFAPTMRYFARLRREVVKLREIREAALAYCDARNNPEMSLRAARERERTFVDLLLVLLDCPYFGGQPSKRQQP